ncbi:MAG TPA: FHA domain-containing protein [Vicinamibacteria bacterium]
MSSRPRIVWQKPDGQRRDFDLGPTPLLIGREEDADIQVDEPLVSRAHARIEQRPEGYVVLDLGSTNLTRVNGEVVSQRLLQHGDEVRFARAVCFYYDRPTD